MRPDFLRLLTMDTFNARYPLLIELLDEVVDTFFSFAEDKDAWLASL